MNLLTLHSVFIILTLLIGVFVVYMTSSSAMVHLVTGSWLRPSVGVRRLHGDNASAASEPANSANACKPVNDVYFLKTHKCASSTVQNLFMRYGNVRNLTFVLPYDGNFFGYPGRFEREKMVPHPSGVYNIFCHHARYNETQIRSLIPRAIFVSIVRRPAELLESLYSFFHYEKRYGVDFDTFLRNPKAHDRGLPEVGPPARNSMLFDFGLDLENSENAGVVDAKIAAILDQFVLIMIVERFNESLVLLRELLCWSWHDVVVFELNARIENSRLTRRQVALADAWSWADARLYDACLRAFEENVRRYGAERMRRDVITLKRHVARAYDRCVGDVVTERETGEQQPRTDVFYFKLKSNDSACVDLTKHELAFTIQLKRKLWPGRKFIR